MNNAHSLSSIVRISMAVFYVQLSRFLPPSAPLLPKDVSCLITDRNVTCFTWRHINYLPRHKTGRPINRRLLNTTRWTN